MHLKLVRFKQAAIARRSRVYKLYVVMCAETVVPVCFLLLIVKELYVLECVCASNPITFHVLSYPLAGVAASEQSRASGIGQEETAAGAAVNSGGEVVVGEMSVEAGSVSTGEGAKVHLPLLNVRPLPCVTRQAFQC